MKKVLFVAATLGGGGAERVMLNLANAIERKGNDVVILQTAIDKNPDINYKISDRITVENIACKYTNKIKRICYKLKRIRNMIKKYKDYTVVSFLPDVNIYCIFACIGLSNRVIVSERNDPNREPGRAWLRKIRDISYFLADYIVFQTKDAQLYFNRNMQKKSSIIPNPLMNAELPLIQFDAPRRNVIIMVCRIKPQKNVGMLVEAINYIKDKLENYTVEIYGDGNLYRDTLVKKVEEYGLENKIQFMGPTKYVYDIMKDSRIYVSTSDYEGISNTMLEALAIGVPSIVTDCPIGGAKMFIKHDENGILVPVGDYKRLGDELVRLINDVELQRKFSCNSIKIRNELGIDIISQKWLDIL